ncbi:hypothetical protein L195_g034847, partial [Trifolium pratense]
MVNRIASFIDSLLSALVLTCKRVMPRYSHLNYVKGGKGGVGPSGRETISLPLFYKTMRDLLHDSEATYTDNLGSADLWSAVSTCFPSLLEADLTDKESRLKKAVELQTSLTNAQNEVDSLSMELGKLKVRTESDEDIIKEFPKSLVDSLFVLEMEN